MCLTVSASEGLTTRRRSRTSYPSGTMPPIHMPFCLEAATLSRIRSPVTSRSNCAKDSKTLSVRRPIEVVVLNCCVTATKGNLACVEDLDHFGEVGQRSGQAVDLVDDHDIDQFLADVFEQTVKGRALHRSARKTTVIVVCLDQSPAFALLTADE